MRVLCKFSPHTLRSLAPSAFVLGLMATSASALTIDDTFLPSFTGTAVTQAQVIAATNQIAALYGNPDTVNILIGASASDGNGAGSQAINYEISYSKYVSLLTTNSTDNPENGTLATALAYLKYGNDAPNPFIGGPLPISLTPANLQALGDNVAGDINSAGKVVTGGTFDGIITVGTTAAISAVMHEVDEVLGGGGQGSKVGSSYCQNNFGNDCYGPLDLYRYSAPFTPSFTTDVTATPYLSVDGGQTDIANFNNSGKGDYGDFTKSPCLIQSWQVCGTTDNYVAGSVEYQMMESIGYDPVEDIIGNCIEGVNCIENPPPLTPFGTAGGAPFQGDPTPLPPTWTLLLAALALFGLVGWRGAKKAPGVLATA
jgi:hypothetical protein